MSFTSYVGKREIAMGYVIPWWLGIAYWEWDRARAVCYPIPLNLLVRGFYGTYYWLKAIQRSTWLDQQLEAARRSGFKAGRDSGLAEAQSKEFEHLQATFQRWLKKGI